MVIDLTYVPTDEGLLYLVTVIDLFSRKKVGYDQADHMRAELCVEALGSAARQRGTLDSLIREESLAFAARDRRLQTRLRWPMIGTISAGVHRLKW